MLQLKHIYFFLVLTTCYPHLIEAKCESCGDQGKKEKNIYTKEANEGDFEHAGGKNRNQEDEIIAEELEMSSGKISKNSPDKKVEKTTEQDEKVVDVDSPKKEEEKLDPEKVKEVLKAIRQVSVQINTVFGKSFDTLDDAITEIDKTIANVTVQTEVEIVKVSEEKGKDLSEVSKVIKDVIDLARADFGEYRNVLEKKKMEVTSRQSKAAVEISSDLKAKEVVKIISVEIQDMMSGGNKITEVMNDMPKELNIIIDKANIVIHEKLKKLEKKLDVDLTSVKGVCQKSLTEIAQSVTASMKQTSGILSMTLNTMMGLVTTLQSSVQ